MTDWTPAEEDFVARTVAIVFSFRAYGFNNSGSIEANDLIVI